MKRIRIVSDGTICGTLVTDAETGQIIDNVECVSFEADANSCSVKATLRIHAPEADLTADLEGSD